MIQCILQYINRNINFLFIFLDALKRLGDKEDILILKSDQNNINAIMDRVQYIEKLNVPYSRGYHLKSYEKDYNKN